MRYKVVSIPWAADGTHGLDWDAEVATTLKEQSTHVKCVIQPAEAEGSVPRRTTAATLARTMMMVGHEFMVRPQRNISAGMHLSFFGGALGTRADSLKPGLLAQLPEGLLWRRGGGSGVVFEVNAKNASSVVLSNSQGVSLVSSWTTKAERWGAATVSACLAIIGKRGLSGKWRAWIENHYRWIVWKLAAVSRQFCVARLTFENILLHLKSRFEREVERRCRPGLKELCLDESGSMGLLILVVSNMYGGNGKGEILVELTDGWYRIHGIFDKDLSCRCARGQIRVGTKLALQGFEILRGTLTDKFSALLAGNDVPTLWLHFNGTRLARSAARLGFQKYRNSMVLTPYSLSSSGGVISAVEAVVQRIRLPSQISLLQEQTVLWLAAPKLHGIANETHLRISFDTTQNGTYTEICEGDTIRVHYVIAVPGHAGEFLLKRTFHSRCEVIKSPASLRDLAASQYIPRSLCCGSHLACLGRDNVGSRVDTVGIILATYDSSASYSTLVLYDYSQDLIFVSLRRDRRQHSSRNLLGIPPGSQVAVLHASLLSTLDDCAMLTCDDLAVVCSSRRSLGKASFGRTRERLQNDWDVLERWARIPLAMFAEARLLCRKIKCTMVQAKRNSYGGLSTLLALLAKSLDGKSRAELELAQDAEDLDVAIRAMHASGNLYYANEKYYLM
tara:strand:- start:1221 stop:3245 length:2025 start_codon:yes stop_codon:yes gene_type:complete